MLDITEMMYESLDALTNNSSETAPTTPPTPTSPTPPITPMTPIIPIHYNPFKTSAPSPSYSIPPSPLHEMEIIRSNDNWCKRHFKILCDSPADSDRIRRHLSRVSSSSTASSSDFSTLTTNTLNSTMSSSPCPTLHNYPCDVESHIDDSDFEKLINPDDSSFNNTNFDVIINVGKEPHAKRFRSNSITLSKRSSYFRTAFSKCLLKKNGDVYLLDKPNMSPKVFTAILRYLHFGSIKLERLDISTILDLLIASDELSLEDFTNEIQLYFIHLNSDWLKTKIVPILQCCYSNPVIFSKLMSHTLTMIKKDSTCLLIQNNLHLLSDRILDNILKECHHGLDDWAIWQCILQWALGQDKIKEFPYDVKKWRQSEFDVLHELMSKLTKDYVRFSHINRNYFLDKVLPYLNYWIRDISKVGQDANEETVLYYLSHQQRHYNHITLHNNIYTNNSNNHYASSSSSTSSASTNIILEDSALINHIHALKITYWIQEGNFIPKIVNTTSTSSKSKKFNPLVRFNFSFFKKKNKQENSSVSTALSISTNILTVTTTKSSTKAQIRQQQQQQSPNITPVSTPAAYQFNLLFRMSRDGASAYYDRCMNQGSIVVLAKIKLPQSSSSNNRYILVGGYNPVGFNYFSNSNHESNSFALVFTFGDGRSFEKSDVTRMMIGDDNCKENNKDCAKTVKDSSKKVTPTTVATLSMKKPKKESIFTKVNNLSSISINSINGFDNSTNGSLCFGHNLIINFHDKFVEYNGGQNFGLVKSDIVECEIFQVKELCY